MKDLIIKQISVEELGEYNDRFANVLFTPKWSKDDVRQMIEESKRPYKKFDVENLKTELSNEIRIRRIHAHNKMIHENDRIYQIEYDMLSNQHVILLMVGCYMTARQLYTLYCCMDSHLEHCVPKERRRLLIQRIGSLPDPFEYDVDDQFIKSIEDSSLFRFNELIELLINSEVIKNCIMPLKSSNVLEGKVSSPIPLKYKHSFVYAVISSPTNPGFISYVNSFLCRLSGELLLIENCCAHFRRSNISMDDEIIKLSTRFPKVTFVAQIYEDSATNGFCRRTSEFSNGIQRDLNKVPGYHFFWISPFEIPNHEDYSAFKRYVENYMSQLDHMKIKGESSVTWNDVSKINSNNYSYKKRNIIAWENDSIKWTAIQTGICYFSVSVQIKESKYNFLWKEINNAKEEVYDIWFDEFDEDEDYD